MISSKGKVFNIHQNKLVRVCETIDTFNSNYWLFSDSPDYNKSISAGYIIPNSLSVPKDCSIPILQISSSPASVPRHNDVIIIHPNGFYAKLFDSRYESNSLFISNACNCKCIMCPQVQNAKKIHNNLDLCLHLIELLPLNIRWLGITGGEPTLNWDGLMDVISRCLRKYEKIKLQLLTNAHVFSDIHLAKELASISANRLYVSIPIYSDNPLDHDRIAMHDGAFFKAISGVQNLENVGIPVELRNVLMAPNYSRLVQWARFIQNNLPFVITVALMSLEMKGHALTANPPIWIPIKKTWPKMVEVKLTFERANIPFQLFNFPLCILPNNLRRHSTKSISEWKRAYCKKCILCSMQNLCGGFFKSSLKYLLPEIEPIIE